ncbi:MAG: hypothetical protein KF915_17100 [Polyangiaceae bacterium]|nr:hypothetical protein [Polyangiaceae bacterium]
MSATTAKRARKPAARAEEPVELDPLGGPVFKWVLGLGVVLLIVVNGSPVGKGFADVLYSIVRQVFEANPPRENAPTTPAAEWGIGKTVPVRITLVTADVGSLWCASEESFEGRHCGFNEINKAWPGLSGALDDNNRMLLQPYRTVNGELLLIGGLWAEPRVAMRLHEEPPHSRPRDRLARFVVDCELKFIGAAKNVKVRWDTAGQWLDPDGDHTKGGVPVALAERCKVE